MFKNGFDLTAFNTKETFIATLKLLGSGLNTKHDLENGYFKWEGSNGDLITANNPLTGEYGRLGIRENELNYASYMRLETFDELVGDAISDFIIKNAYVKEHTRGKAKFI